MARSVSRLHAAQVQGLSGRIVTIEVDIARGLRSFSIVGLPDTAVREAKDRITAAIRNSGLASPGKGNKKIIVSLAPADLKKEGALFDVGIALGYLVAARIVRYAGKKAVFLGELGLAGELRPAHGVLALARTARDAGFAELYVPAANAREAALVDGIAVRGVRSLRELVEHLDPSVHFAGEEPGMTPERTVIDPTPHAIPRDELVRDDDAGVDFAHIHGQETARRALEIAAAGGHNIAFVGPPGAGKTMLAKAIPTILPPLSEEEILETTAIHSVAGVLAEDDVVLHPPFRSPHHTASHAALVGGGAVPRPGEITLAHNGVLFLDEFPEFDRRVIEALRQPLEDRVVTVSRVKGAIRFPARFMLVAAANPCPCGNRGNPRARCDCSENARARYVRKLSGPIVDRIDLWITVPPVSYAKLGAEADAEGSAAIRERVVAARERQRARFADLAGVSANAHMGARELKRFVSLAPAQVVLLTAAAERLGLSARAWHRIQKVARTIADLAGHERVEDADLTEALTYRAKRVL